MQRSLRLPMSLTGVAALALASSPIQPVAAQDDGSAADLGVMEINLKDAVQFNWGFQGALQGAGTPNQAGIGAFLPIAVGENSVFFIDALANANFSDYDGNNCSSTWRSFNSYQLEPIINDLLSLLRPDSCLLGIELAIRGFRTHQAKKVLGIG